MLDLSSVVNDHELAQAFVIMRPSAGGWQAGKEGIWQEGITQNINAYGVIQPAKNNDILTLVPEGERADKMIAVYCSSQIKMSDGEGIASDYILWNNEKYRVAYSKLWQDFGYYFVIAALQAEA